MTQPWRHFFFFLKFEPLKQWESIPWKRCCVMILFWTGLEIFERVQHCGSFTGKTEKECSDLFQIKITGVLPPIPSTSSPSSRRLTKAQAGSYNADGVARVVAIPRIPEEASNCSSNESILRHTGVCLSLSRWNSGGYCKKKVKEYSWAW